MRIVFTNFYNFTIAIAYCFLKNDYFLFKILFLFQCLIKVKKKLMPILMLSQYDANSINEDNQIIKIK